MINMNYDQINRDLMEFLDHSPVTFFAVRNMSRKLEEAGARRLLEGERWQLEAGQTYYVTRNDSALIAFRIPEEQAAAKAGFHIIASHCDSPTFKIKTCPELHTGPFISLNAEKYGGMICASWFDRPLSVAGRVLVRTKEGVETRLICIDRDLLIIPRLAIHMNREVNDGYKINVQKDMIPLFTQEGIPGMPEASADSIFRRMIADEAGVEETDVLDMDMYLYNREPARVLGLKGEFISSGRLDDLQCAFASLQGFLKSPKGACIPVHCVYDNEEVGSSTKQGAASTFLHDVLTRISGCLGDTAEDYICRLQRSLMLSADNAHSLHPNYPEKADAVNRPVLNGGIVIKYSANQKYTTDAVSGALFREICRAAEVPVQVFHNRSDQLGGSTLGNISTAQVAVNAVDIGLPQLAMHSAYETAGARDTAYLVEAAGTFFGASLEGKGDGTYRLTLQKPDEN